MVDADEEGYLLQIFTKPVQDRPTLFLKSFKEWEPKALVQVILKLCSRESRHYEEHYKTLIFFYIM
jgi:hypothetical protein